MVIRQFLPSSRTTQSMPSADTHWSVVGAGGCTPQRRTTAAGSPQAAVAWLSVGRRARSEIVSGIATIAGAQAGSAAFSAAGTEATRPWAQPVAVRATADSRAAARSPARTGEEE